MMVIAVAFASDNFAAEALGLGARRSLGFSSDPPYSYSGRAREQDSLFREKIALLHRLEILEVERGAGRIVHAVDIWIGWLCFCWYTAFHSIRIRLLLDLVYLMRFADLQS